ncbi:MAG: VOC family protein [Acidimicrobiales bacterium]|nr:VOC family protein [Acidimicrobiales bacterium]
MAIRNVVPNGAPCWVDLWTSDVERSRSFYSQVFGWVAQDPSPEFGGYFMFTKNGTPIAGGMGDMGDMKANNTWKSYLSVTDISQTLELVKANGGTTMGEADVIANLGTQCVILDPNGATTGIWQADTFPGFVQINEHGTPSWFELFATDYKGEIDFYTKCFGWSVNEVSNTDEFRYSVFVGPNGNDDLIGVMDASSFNPEGDSSFWSIYWEVDNVDETCKTVSALDGQILDGPTDTPYGRIASVADPSGAKFKLRKD